MSEFVFNDIRLNIPPEQIIVRRDSINNRWQALRTEGSIKLPSGFSRLSIQMPAIRFTDTVDEDSKYTGLQKLQMIVAQIRVTPFVWIENSFLRSQIALGNNNQAMMFVVRTAKITTDPNFTNVLTLSLELDYFNYFPYMSDIVFKQDLWIPKPVSEPRYSKAWKRLYLAEMKRNSYSGFADKSTKVIELNGEVTLSTTQFAQISLNDYKQLTTELAALKQLKKILQDSESLSADTTIPTFNDITDIVDKVTADRLISEIFGNTTTMTKASGVLAKDAAADALSKLEHLTTNENNSRYSIAIDPSSWSVVQLANGFPVGMPTSIDQVVNRDKPVHSSKEVLLLSRERSIKLNSGLPLQSSLIASAIELDLETRVATIPMAGYEFPTFQSLGGTDATLTIGISTTGENSLQALSAFYTMVEEQNRKFRLIPAGQRTIRITNDIANMLGYQEFILSKLELATTQSPGTYTATLQLESSPIVSTTQEAFVRSQGFLSEHDVRLALIDIIENNITTYAKALDPSNPRILLNKNNGTFSGSFNNLTIENETSRIYSYKGPDGPENIYFKKLMDDYIKNLQETFNNCLKNILYKIQSSTKRVDDKFVSAFFTLTNQDILGIERIKKDIYKIIKESSAVKGIINAKIKVYNIDTEVSDSKSIAYSNKLLFIALNNLHEGEKVLTSNEEIERKTKYAEKIVSDIRKSVIDPVAVAVEEELSDWQKFIVPFLDNIIFGGIEVPQFADILRQFKNKRGSLSSGDCYPDFPSKQVIADLEKDKTGSESLKNLKLAYEKNGLDIKNIGYTALVNPDFYIYNPQIDNGQSIIPEQLMKAAVTTIQTIQGSDQFGKVTKSWFEDQYKSEVIGPDRADELKKLREEQKQAKADEFFKINKDRISIESKTFESSTLINGNSGFLAPSIAQNAQDRGKPIQALEVSSKNDKWNTTSKRANSEILTATEHNFSCQHDFSLNSLSYQAENKYLPPPVGDPNKIPSFRFPVESGWKTQSESQDFGPRKPIDTIIEGTGEKSTSSTDHKGLDFSYGKSGSEGRKVYASAAGKIKVVKSKDTPRGKFNGNHIVIDHGNGWTTWYLHLQDSDIFTRWNALFNEQGISQDQKDRLLQVASGAELGNIGMTGRSAGAHLHFEIHQNTIPVDPLKYLNGEAIPSQGPPLYMNPRNESLMTKSVEQFTKELNSGQGQGLIRAYPTYRLYFIESDEGERKHFGFDDFFSYSSITDIGVIRSRKLAADVVTISMTNISGVLSNRKFKEDGGLNDGLKTANGKVIEEDERKGTANTINENPFASLMLQPGIQIQLRMGYSSNPDELDTVFNGLITEVGFSENDSMVQIICQSFAMELVQTLQGDFRSFGGWFRSSGGTGHIIEELLCSPDVSHFGRWNKGEKPDMPGETRSLLRDNWKRVPSPQDDNIFAPTGRGIWGIFDSSPKYTMYQTNIWEVIQEMTLRHPGYIVSTVPYEGKWGPRMTMFFGVPDQMYFHRDPNLKETNIQESLRDYINGDIDDTRTKLLGNLMDGSQSVKDILDETEQILSDEGINTKDKDFREAWLQHILKTYAKDKGVIKTFRNYHVLTSSMHILSNSISSDAQNTFTVATIQHSNDGWLSDGAAEVDEEIGTLKFDNADTTTLLVDAGLADEEKREVFLSFPNCVGSEMARQMAVSALWRSQKDGYSGTIEIIGNPSIKPYDICYVFDEINDMYGPIEVEQVVHRFNENGFITEIIPDMVCHVNQATTMASSDAMSLVAEHALKSIGMAPVATMIHNGLSFGRLSDTIFGETDGLDKTLAIAAVPLAILNRGFNLLSTVFFNTSDSVGGSSGASTIFGLTGAFFWSKFMTNTQFAHPITYSPLVMNGKPMLGGTPVRRVDNSFIQSVNGWFKGKAYDGKLYLDEVYDNINPNNWIVPQGKFWKSINGSGK